MSLVETIVKKCSPEDQKVLKEWVSFTADKIRENDCLKQKIDCLKHELQVLKRIQFAGTSEKISLDTQSQEMLPLFNDFELIASQVELEKSLEEEPETRAVSQGRPRGRKPLPAHLPRVIVEHDLPEEEKQCTCGEVLTCFGAVTSEQLRYQPARFEVIEHRCKKYGCQRCNQRHKIDWHTSAVIKTAAKPLSLLPKSIATPELLSQIILSKFEDALPLYRQEATFARAGIALSRQTMSHWVLKVSEQVIPIVNLLQEWITETGVAFCDETPVQVLHEPGRKPQATSYMWCFIGVQDGNTASVYQYQPSRSGQIARDFFDGFQGALHCDGYAGYNALLEKSGIVGVSCMAHVRRKFFEALPNGKVKGVAGQALRLIQGLYRIERQLKETDASAATIARVRQQHAKPILNQLRQFLDDKKSSVPPQSPVGKAIAYALNRWTYLTTYLQDGRYEIDNNRAERAIKPFVIGRKNWLFSNTPAGAHSSARLYTLIETAKANGIKPNQYFNQIFKELPYCSTLEDYEKLLPWNVKAKLDSS